MFEDKALWAYQSMACFLQEEHRMPGVKDEDRELECMMRAFEDIQQELCLRMYRYGVENG